jgi:hypothetical protein
VIKGAGERRSQFRTRPIRGCLRDQQMEQGVIGGRDGSAEAGLTRRVDVSQMLREPEQLIGERHYSGKCELVEPRLLGLAAVIEIREHTPPFDRLNFVADYLLHTVTRFQ